MSNSIELINKVKELEAELHKLKEELMHEQDEPEIPDKPDFEMDEIFYYLSSFTDGIEESYVVDIGDIDFNMFHTKEYTDEFAKNCKLIAMMLHCKWYLDRNYVPDWDYVHDWESDTDSEKFYVIFDNCDNKFQVRTRYAEKGVEVYFSTAKAAQKCADWLNKHWRDSE